MPPESGAQPLPGSYRLFGLTLLSEVSLPFTPTAEPTAEPDVVIRRRSVPRIAELEADITGIRYAVPGPRWLIRDTAVGVAALIEEGSRVDIDYREDDAASEHAARLYLLGSCLGALLTQRGFVLLHGNALMGPRGAIVVCGHVGAGKSTTTYALLRRGYRLLADDVCVFDVSGESPVVLPGVSEIKLWKSTLDRFDEPSAGLRRVRADIEKFYVPVEAQQRPARPVAIYMLDVTAHAVGAIPTRSRLTGAEALLTLSQHTYKSDLHEIARWWPSQLRGFAAAIAGVPVNVIARPARIDTLEAVADLIEQDLGT